MFLSTFLAFYDTNIPIRKYFFPIFSVWKTHANKQEAWPQGKTIKLSKQGVLKCKTTLK